jgi:hypothetical protein
MTNIIFFCIAVSLLGLPYFILKLEKVDLVHSKFWMRQWKEWNMLWFILQLIHFMAFKNLQILVIDNVVNFLLLAKLI